jgi:hypothetical protein
MPEPTLHCWLGGKVTDQAHTAAQAVRQIIHLTLLPHPIPAPDVYLALAELEDLLVALERVLRYHLGRALEASLNEPLVHDTRSSVERSRDRLDQAATHVFAAGLAVAAARAAIADHGRQVDAAVTR